MAIEHLMRKFFHAILVAGLLVGAALGQAPSPVPPPAPAPAPPPKPQPAPPPVVTTISGETSVPCYGFLKFESVGPFKSAFWFCIPSESSGASIVSEYMTKTWKRPDGASVSGYVLGGAPGRYTIRCIVSDPQGEMTGLSVVGEIRPLPLPPQPTPPEPPPTPTPIPPGPTPGPHPGPRPPFPSTQSESGGRGLRRA